MKLPAQPNGRLYVVIGVFLLSVSRKLPVSVNGRVSPFIIFEYDNIFYDNIHYYVLLLVVFFCFF